MIINTSDSVSTLPFHPIYGCNAGNYVHTRGQPFGHQFAMKTDNEFMNNGMTAAEMDTKYFAISLATSSLGADTYRHREVFCVHFRSSHTIIHELIVCFHSKLVSKRLSACVNIVPGITSVYRWKGSVETESEGIDDH